MICARLIGAPSHRPRRPQPCACCGPHPGAPRLRLQPLKRSSDLIGSARYQAENAAIPYIMERQAQPATRNRNRLSI